MVAYPRTNQAIDIELFNPRKTRLGRLDFPLYKKRQAGKDSRRILKSWSTNRDELLETTKAVGALKSASAPAAG